MTYNLRKYKFRTTCYSLLLVLGTAALALAVGPRIHSDPVIEASANSSYTVVTRPGLVTVTLLRGQVRLRSSRGSEVIEVLHCGQRTTIQNGDVTVCAGDEMPVDDPILESLGMAE